MTGAGRLLAAVAVLALLPAGAAAADADWSDGAGRAAGYAAVLDGVVDARYVLLGEIHDNPAHHRLQARILEDLVEMGRRPAVVWEMVDRDRQPRIDAYLARPEPTADGFAEAVAWSQGGWPDFALYRPIVRVALAAGLPMVAAGIGRDEVRAIATAGDGLAGFAGRRKAAWRLPDLAVGEDARRAHEEALFEGHCRLMPRPALGPMIDVQVARDASFAAAVVAADEGEGAVLIAGNGHVRRDIAVPLFLDRLASGRGVATVMLLETGGAPPSPGQTDWAGVTEPAERPDPCEGLAKRMGTKPAASD